MLQHDFNYAALDVTAHRPWPLPPRPWVMRQTWHDLLFIHWPVDPLRLRALVPPMFELHLYDGCAWLGIVPFDMTNVAPRAVPAMPWLSAFPEVNVRTYVRVGGVPGIWFLSLDAGNPLAVRAARTLLNLPYFSASMRVSRTAGSVHYRSRRHADRATFVATYGPLGDAAPARAHSVEAFLTERYCLYHLDHHGEPYRLQIHHPAWLLQPAWCSMAENTLAAAQGIELPPTAPLLHFARRQDMVAFAPEPLAQSAARMSSTAG